MNSIATDSQWHWVLLRLSSRIQCHSLSFEETILATLSAASVKSMNKPSPPIGFLSLGSMKESNSSSSSVRCTHPDGSAIDLSRSLASMSFPSERFGLISGASARAKRAWDRSPYSWNMVNLFSLGCHVTDRAYVRTRLRIVWVG